MNVQNARSSDLQLARQLSRRLAAPALDAPATPSPQYARFVGKLERATPRPSRRATLAPGQQVPTTPLVPALGPVAAPAPAPPRELINADHVDSWEQFLAWCSLNAGVESAFVVDSQGFVIGQHGQLMPEEFDGVGAELSLAMEQLARIEALQGELGSAVLAFGTRILIGFRGKIDNAEMVLGLVATDILAADVMDAIGPSFRSVLPKLA